MSSHTPAGSRLFLAALLAVTAPPALALGLGEADLRSALGEPLDLLITITAGPEDALAPDCFYLPRPIPGALPTVARAQFTLENGPKLRVRTPQPLNEPAMVLRMHASCPGGGLVAREYPLLLDPRPVEAITPPLQAPRAATAPGTPPPSAPGLRTIAGDTLAGLAKAVYPTNRRAREAYVAALRETNPALASLGPDEEISPGTNVELPDLRAVAKRTANGAARPMARVPADDAAPAPKAGREQAAADRKAAPRERKAPAARTRDASPRTNGPVLRLSSGEVDLARSREIDDRTRAQLRERLTLLDADDQVSALLQLRNNLRQLENRVAEMQLRLSGPIPVAPGTAPAAATPARPAMAEGAEAIPTPARPADALPSAPAEPPMAAASPAPSPAPAKAAAAPAARTESAPVPTFPLRAWGLLALAVAGLALFAFLVIRRRSRRTTRRRAAEPAYGYAGAAGNAEAAAVDEQGPDSRILDPEGMFDPAGTDEPPVRAPAPRAAGPATLAPSNDPQALRRRYLEERFPEVANGAVDLADADSVVKGARLFYEDGALPRAVELLQFALEENPAPVKPWLALFEILRLENLAGEFATLAARFRVHHGTSDNWRKVQFIGREIDPGNALYRDDAFNSLETIGYPNAAKARAITFDPLAENWLNAPMDFTSDAIAAELRQALLADAGLTESDLVPNPMPALKRVEMFDVA